MNKNSKGLLFLTPRLYPCDSGGVELFHYFFMYSICRYFNVSVSTNCSELTGGNCIRIHCYPNQVWGSSYLSHIFHQTKLIVQNRKQIDLIHIPYSSKSELQNYHVLVLSKMLRIPYILRIHGGGMHPGRPHYLHQKLFDGAAGVVAVSTPIKAEYERRHGKPITMIPSMLPFKAPARPRGQIRRCRGFQDHEVILLFVGTIKGIKGPDVLLQALRDIGMDYLRENRVKLLYAGDGPMKEELENSVRESFLRAHVFFLGHVPYDKIGECYAMADIFVIPSLKEARPLVLSEALFHGLPSVGSDISTIANIIAHGRNGLLFKSGDARELSLQIRTLVSEPGLRGTLGSEARRTYRKSYVYEHMIEDYKVFYEHMIRSCKLGKTACGGAAE